MMTIRGQFKDVIDATVRGLFTTENEEQSTELYYQNLGLNDYEPDVPDEVLSDLSGPGRASLSGEGQEYNTVVKINGYTVTLKLRKYTFKIAFTEEDKHWLAKSASSKRLTEVRDAVSGGVQALNQRINEDACKVFYLGFGTTFLNVGNSEALFGSHTIKGTAGTQKNTFATGTGHLALTGSTAISDALAIMNRFQAHNGIQLLRSRALKLVVGPELEAIAYKIVNSEYGPNNNNLGLQESSNMALSKRGITINVETAPDVPYAYRTYWFLVETNRAKKRAFIAWAWKPRMNSDWEYHNGTEYMVGSTFFGPVVKGWQWAFGSKGDASAS